MQLTTVLLYSLPEILEAGIGQHQGQQRRLSWLHSLVRRRL